MAPPRGHGRGLADAGHVFNLTSMGEFSQHQLEPERPRAFSPLLAAIGALVLIGIAVTGFWLLRPQPVPPSPPPVRVTPTPRPTPTPTAPPATPTPLARPTPRPRPAATPAPAPPQARLRIESDVPGAQVFVDRRFVGTAPVDVTDVAPGPHRVNASADGYEMQAQDIELGNEPLLVSMLFKQVRLDESVDVVHKHGLGSCRGRLHATPAGLSFRAESGSDSFETPLASLQQFEVDYLRKNLRVSIRRGRTYNFTTDAANADPLLVFQQKVSAALKRLGQ